MNTLISNVLKVTCSVLFAVATSGILPATAYAAKPTTSPQNSALHRNANAFDHGPKQDQTTTQVQIPAYQEVQPASDPSNDNHAVISEVSKATAPQATKTHHPSGNNGFIKVNQEIMPDSIPSNDPHVSCNLKVEFYNYDQNPDYRANVSFALHSPTKKTGQTMSVNGDTNPFIGEDAVGGSNDLDAVRAYKLSFTGTPHAKQGYHVKLTIHADGSRGADVKHKVFWVQPCTLPGQGGNVLPAKTTVATTAGKTLSTSTVSSSSVLPGKLSSTGTGLNIIISALTALMSLVTYFAVLRMHRFAPEKI